jgi:hypothetical protein
MKTLIRNFIAVMAFMIIGHVAVVAQEDEPSFKIEATQTGYIATATDSSDFAIVVEPNGAAYLAFRNLQAESLQAVAVAQSRCTGEVTEVEILEYASYDYARGILFIQITSDINTTDKAIKDNILLNHLKGSDGELIAVPDLPDLSLVLYYICNSACEECGFTKPSCDTKRL